MSENGFALEVSFPEASLPDASLPEALRLRALRKSFGQKDGQKPAVDGLDLTIRPGEFYALLGANGAGKTTTLRMVAGLLKPDSGKIFIGGTDARKYPLAAKALTAWLPDEPLLYDKLAPLEYLEFVAGLWGLDAALAASRARKTCCAASACGSSAASAARGFFTRACARRWRSPAR